jgi:hypothetical protein
MGMATGTRTSLTRVVVSASLPAANICFGVAIHEYTFLHHMFVAAVPKRRCTNLTHAHTLRTAPQLPDIIMHSMAGNFEIAHCS